MQTSSEYSYFLEHPLFGSKEVTSKEWEAAGGKGNTGFTANGVTGVCKSKVTLPAQIIKVHPDRITLRDVLTEQGIL